MQTSFIFQLNKVEVCIKEIFICVCLRKNGKAKNISQTLAWNWKETVMFFPTPGCPEQAPHFQAALISTRLLYDMTRLSAFCW
jgi:hypothetical protein